MSEFEHLRANVPKRRLGYKLFIVAAFVVFATSLVDILWLDNLLYFGVLGAYGLLFLWAILLLISRRRPGQVRLGEVVLNCPNCDNAFLYGSTHLADPAGTMITCPVCAQASELPPAGSQPRTVVLPDTTPVHTAYRCDHCDEHITVATFGQPPRDVRFRACPQCHQTGTLLAAGNVSTQTVRKTGWHV